MAGFFNNSKYSAQELVAETQAFKKITECMMGRKPGPLAEAEAILRRASDQASQFEASKDTSTSIESGPSTPGMGR